MGFFGTISSSGGEGSNTTTIVNTPSSYVVDTISDRNALDAINGAVCHVNDASADSTVESGFATYIKVNTNWVKFSDERLLNIQGVSEEERSKWNNGSNIYTGENPPSDTSVVWLTVEND